MDTIWYNILPSLRGYYVNAKISVILLRVRETQYSTLSPNQSDCSQDITFHNVFTYSLFSTVLVSISYIAIHKDIVSIAPSYALDPSSMMDRRRTIPVPHRSFRRFHLETPDIKLNLL